MNSDSSLFPKWRTKRKTHHTFVALKKFVDGEKTWRPLISQESTASTALTARAPLLQFHSLPQQQRLGPFISQPI